MMNFTDIAQKTGSIIKYAFDLRLTNPDLSTEEAFKISEEMHNHAHDYGKENLRLKSELVVGDIVRCVNNDIRDAEYTQCLELEVGREYKVVEKTSMGMIYVDDAVSGRVAHPFYPDRFEQVTQVEGSSTDNQ